MPGRCGWNRLHEYADEDAGSVPLADKDTYAHEYEHADTDTVPGCCWRDRLLHQHANEDPEPVPVADPDAHADKHEHADEDAVPGRCGRDRLLHAHADQDAEPMPFADENANTDEHAVPGRRRRHRDDQPMRDPDKHAGAKLLQGSMVVVVPLGAA